MVWVWELSTGVFIKYWNVQLKRVVLMMLSLFINFPMSLCIKAKVYLIRWIAANYRAVVWAAHATKPPREDKITIFREWKKASTLSRSGTKQQQQRGEQSTQLAADLASQAAHFTPALIATLTKGGHELCISLSISLFTRDRITSSELQAEARSSLWKISKASRVESTGLGAIKIWHGDEQRRVGRKGWQKQKAEWAIVGGNQLDNKYVDYKINIKK